MLPTTLAHEVIEFGSAIARVLWTPDLDGLRAQLAPSVTATAEGTDNFFGLLILLLVDEDGVQASTVVDISTAYAHTRIGEKTYLRQWMIVEKRAICISLKISYCFSFRPSC